MRFGLSFGLVVLAIAALPATGVAEPVVPQGPLNTIRDVRRAFRGCWQWPPLSESRPGMELTVRLSFKRNGEILSFRVAHQTPEASDEERAHYYKALLTALDRCSPLPMSESLAAAIAGRPMTIHIQDRRQQRKA
jgi:hypothetical protein